MIFILIKITIGKPVLKSVSVSEGNIKLPWLLRMAKPQMIKMKVRECFIFISANQSAIHTDRFLVNSFHSNLSSI